MVSDGLRQNFWKLETCMFTVWTFNMHIHSKLLEHTFVVGADSGLIQPFRQV